MKDDSLSDLHVNAEVTLRGRVKRMSDDSCLVEFPEINASVWVYERNVHQPFFVRSCPPAESSYAAIRYACDRLKAENERLREALSKRTMECSEVRHKAEEGLRECLHLTECLSRVAGWHISGLLRDKVSTSDSLIDLVSQARDVAWTLQGIWEAVSERQNPTA